MKKNLSENLWRELYQEVEKKNWKEAVHIFDLLLQQFFYPTEVPQTFNDLSNQDILQMMKDVELLQYGAGEVIVREGERSDSLFVVVNGVAEVSCSVKSKHKCTIPLPCVLADKLVSNYMHGNEVLFSELKGGDIFGEMALISSNPRTATIVAKSKVELIKLKKVVMDKIFERQPQIQKYLYDLYFTRVNELLRTIKGSEENKKSILEDILNCLKSKKHEVDSVSLDQGIRKLSSPIYHLKNADELFRQGLKKESILSYNKAASLFFEQGLLDKALIIYKIIAHIDSDNEEARQGMNHIVSILQTGKSLEPSSQWMTSASKHEFFSHLTSEEIKDMLSRASVRQYKKREVVVQEGEQSDALYIIKEGTAKVVTHLFGETVHLATLKCSDIFGEASFLTGRPRTASVIANETLKVYVLDRFVLEELIKGHPDIIHVLDETYRVRLEDNLQQIDEAKENIIKSSRRSK